MAEVCLNMEPLLRCTWRAPAVGAMTIAVRPRRGRKGRGFRCPSHIARCLAPMFPRGCGIQSRPCNCRQNHISSIYSDGTKQS